MLLHNFMYSLLVLLRSRGLVFWTIAFPLIMAVLFNLAMSNIESSEKFQKIDIAVVQSEDYDNNMIFKNALEALSGEDGLFRIKETDLKTAESMLNEKSITGYLTFSGDDVAVTVKNSGINETILCRVMNEIKSDSEIVVSGGTDVINQKIASGEFNISYEDIFREETEKLTGGELKFKDTSPAHMSYVMIEYYSLIAMACLYSGLLTIVLIDNKMPDISAVGKRCSVSPTGKFASITGSLLAAFVVQLFGLALLFALLLLLGADFGSQLLYIILLSVAGTFAGLTAGIAVSVLIKTNENAKTTIMISITMACCFLSGMMGISMKNIVDVNAPFINRINPVAMITDGLYALYFIGTGSRYYIDLASLVAFSLIMLILSWSRLRRQKYDSI